MSGHENNPIIPPLDARVIAGKSLSEATAKIHSIMPTLTLDLSPDFERQLERNRIVAHRARSSEADLFRLLRTQVLQTMNKLRFKTLAITSPCYGDGKTTIAINLAISIALDVNQTVLLADLDLRKPNLHEYLGLEPECGLTDHLVQNVPLPNCLMPLPFARLKILPAGQTFDHSSEILGIPKMAALADELKSRYPDRMIIYDMPPLLEQDDPLAFMPHVDAYLLIVQDGKTKEEDLKRCLEILGPATVLGIVLNNSI